MERIWLGEAKLKYANNWIVAVNTALEEKNKAYGDIYLITPSKSEAYAKAIELNQIGTMGSVSVTQGTNNTPQIGGLEVWSQ